MRSIAGESGAPPPHLIRSSHQDRTYPDHGMLSFLGRSRIARRSLENSRCSTNGAPVPSTCRSSPSSAWRSELERDRLSRGAVADVWARLPIPAIAEVRTVARLARSALISPSTTSTSTRFPRPIDRADEASRLHRTARTRRSRRSPRTPPRRGAAAIHESCAGRRSHRSSRGVQSARRTGMRSSSDSCQ